MADPTGDLFDGLDRPRALPAPLRERLEAELLSAAGVADVVPLGDELDERLTVALTDPVAVALTGIDGPRPLPADVRGRLEGRLLRRRHRAQRFIGAAAAVVLVAAVALLLTQPGTTQHPRRPAAAAPATVPSAAAGDTEGGTGAVAVGAGTAGGSTGSTSQTTGQAPAPGPLSQPAAGTDSRSIAVGLSSAAPNAGPVSGGTTVTLRGRGLSTATRVTFGGRVASYQVLSDTALRVVTPPAAAAAAVDIVVQVRSGTSYRLSSAFTYLPRPSVTSLSPATGSTSGGTWVSIRGTALSRVTAVDFGDAAATRVEVVSDGELRALSPSHSAGPVDVTVTTPGGTSATSTGDRFTYLP